MGLKRKTAKGVTTLSISDALTIYTVTQLYGLIFEEYEKPADSIALDLSAVSDFDSAGVQLLLFLKKNFEAANKKLFVVKSNEVVDRVFAMLDVAFIFHKESKL